MKPGDHPEFFRWPAPAGRSRESSIVLDACGQFWHDDEPVRHRGMAKAFAGWIRRHPDDHRFILSNGYDWCYLSVKTTAYFVQSARLQGDAMLLQLFDESEEQLQPETLWANAQGQVGCRVKNGDYWATFSRQAQLQLEPLLVGDDAPYLLLGGKRYGFADSPL